MAGFRSFLLQFGLRLSAPVLLGLLLCSCDRELPPDPSGELYFPLSDGLARVYRVIDTTYTTADTLRDAYWKQELINGSVTDLTGRSLKRLELARSPEEGSPFVFEQLWTLYRGSEFAERIEGNTRLRPLRFPLQQDQSWNGNALNNLGEEQFVYLSLDSTVELNGRVFEDCVVVEQRNSGNSLLTDILTYEIFAPGIGRIKRYDRFQLWQFVTVDSSGARVRQLDTDSYITEETLVDYSLPDPLPSL